MTRGAGISVRIATATGFAGLLLAGCSMMNQSPAGADALATRSQDERSRAERVFLYQSRVADALLDQYPLVEVFERADPTLIAAESHMTESCGHLTRAVLAHMEGREPSLGLKFKVMNSIDECERSAQRIEQLLHAVGPARAGDDSI